MKRRSREFYILLCLLLYGQFGLSQTIDERLESYSNSFDIEKIYVHHDRPSYMQGDTIWCKVYYLDGVSHEFIQEQSIIYAEWIDPNGNLLESYDLKVNEGKSMLDIVIDPLAKTGEYTLKVYTLYQLNFDKGLIFQKKIKVTGYEDDVTETKNEKGFEIQFFPEGGYLVEGLESRIAFKAVDELGKSITVSGKVVNGNGQEVASFEALDVGLGLFDLTPAIGQEYTAIVEFEGIQKEVALSKALGEGYAMYVSSVSDDLIQIGVHANEKVDLKDCKLVGQQRGETFLSHTLVDNNGLDLSLEKDDLPYGLLHFTLFDNSERPVSERLVYNTRNTEEIVVDIIVPEDNAGAKSVNEISISSEDLSKQYKANLSLSVYNKQYTESASGINIKNYLELQSELRGKISNINRYLEADNAESRALLDLLLMTQGWSRFTWQEVLADDPKEIIYPKERNFSLSGKVLKAKKDEPVKADLLINVLDQEAFSINNFTTEDEGVFYIDDLGIEDSTNIFIQANIHDLKNEKKLEEGELRKLGDSNVDIKLNDLKEYNFDPSLSMLVEEVKASVEQEKEAQVREIVNTKLGLENIDSSLWSLSIDEVIVKGKKLDQRRQRLLDTKREYRKRKIFHLGTTEKLYASDLYRYEDKFDDVYDMISSAIPMTYVDGPRGDRKIMKQGSNGEFFEVHVALNHDLVSPHYLDFIDPEQVVLIELVFGPECDPLFWKCPVARVVTRSDDPLLDAKIDGMTKGTLNIAHSGFYKAKEYYKKMYDDDVFTSGSDERVTLYWDPDVELNGDTYTIEFSTSNLGGEHVIHLEGITEDGVPIVAKKSFYVESREP